MIPVIFFFHSLITPLRDGQHLTHANPSREEGLSRYTSSTVVLYMWAMLYTVSPLTTLCWNVIF